MALGNTCEPTVSVIVPVLNAEATIKDLLDSLIEIDYEKRKLEILMVDGGSTDRTREIIRRYPVKLVLEERRGLNVARNTGVRNSGGEIILFTDSDCVVPRNWIRKMVKDFEDPEVGCVGGSISRYDDAFLSRYADESIMPVLRRFKKREALSNVELFTRYPAGCNMAFRRSAIEKVNGFDEGIRYGFDEDELVERVCESGYEMVLDPEVTVKHQHRATLRGLFKQNFNYGRGGALLLRKKKARDRLSRWILISLILFVGWMVASVSLAGLAIISGAIFLIPLLPVTVVPFFLLILSYLRKTIREKEYIIVSTYPFIDTLRLFAFCTGEIYGLIG